MKRSYFFIAFIVFIFSCEKDSLNEDFSGVLSLYAEDNDYMAEADNVDKVRIVAELPLDYSAENGTAVDFYILKEVEEKQTAEIRLTNDSYGKRRVAVIEIKHDKEEEIIIKAIAKVNGQEVVKTIKVQFVRAINYLNDIQLNVLNNNAEANNFDKVRIIIDMPEEFPEIENNKVHFKIFKSVPETFDVDVRLVQLNGEVKKVADVEIKHNIVENINCEMILKINGIEFRKETFISFKKAFLESLNITSSSLQISPNNFNTVTITTQLNRQNGIVSLNTTAITKAKDDAGNPVGIFVNFDDKTDIDGKIVNLFTLGNSEYTGPIHFTVETLDSNGEPFESPTLTIYSN